MLPASVDRSHTRHITEMASLERAAHNRNNGIYFWCVPRLSNRKIYAANCQGSTEITFLYYITSLNRDQCPCICNLFPINKIIKNIISATVFRKRSLEILKSLSGPLHETTYFSHHSKFRLLSKARNEDPPPKFYLYVATIIKNKHWGQAT